MTAGPKPITQRIVEVFLLGNLAPLLVLLSVVAGVAALWLTPREEEPQIVVPLADVLVDVPGASAAEVERTVATRLEKLLFQIDGVEYVYSISRPSQAIVTVRFFVGEDREDSLLKLHNKLQMSVDRIPPQVAGWVVKPIEVDDVPIVGITLFSDRYGDFELRRMAEEIEHRIQAVPGTGLTSIAGGPPRRLRVLLQPDALQSRGVSLAEIRAALARVSVRSPAAEFDRGDRRISLTVDATPPHEDDLARLVVATRSGRPVYLHELAEVIDGPAERESYTRIAFGPGGRDRLSPRLRDAAGDFPAVTIAVAKQKGRNAVWVARAVAERVEELRRTVLPDEVEVWITRDHGRTANDKVNELLEGLAVAVVIVIALLAMSLGTREALVVATAVPITFALTLLLNYLAGYSINRVTLFALILALGLVVDDPIVDVENIHRHLRAGREKPLQAVLRAVNEVRPPIILATLAVMVSFLPMFFITGMMGPYMAPMALNVPLAMFMSLLVAFTITPWLSHLVLSKHAAAGGAGVDPDELATRGWIAKVYGGVMKPLLRSRGLRWSVLGATAVLLLASGHLALARRVPLKMLPFDNKDELQVVIDLPEGTTLERTEAVAAEASARLRAFAEVVDVTSFAGEPSPIDFNGMVRHYFLRRAPHQADLRVNLIHKKERVSQSHDLALIFREALRGVGEEDGAKLQVVEPPPGPPVIATVAVEVYGDASTPYDVLADGARAVGARLSREPGVVEVDDTVEAEFEELRFVVDREKASLHGLLDADIAELLRAATAGAVVATLHAPREVDPLAVELRLPRALRSSREDLEQLPIPTADGAVVRLGEIGAFVSARTERAIYHKNLRRVAYVFAEVAGRAPAEVILDVQQDQRPPGASLAGGPVVPVEDRDFIDNMLGDGGGVPWSLPAGVTLDWAGEGEWKITLDAFRDLGIAFLGACFGIYLLLVHETKSYLMPLILMLSIPFTIIGIMPGFWLLNALSAGEVAGHATPTFFTATAMIGMIALSGIAVRNAILLIEFLHRAEDAGGSLREAILQAGAVRLRPIFLTAGTAMLAALPITLDPIFSGLAWALIFGLVVSSAFTLVLVPLVYFMVYGGRARPRTVTE